MSNYSELCVGASNLLGTGRGNCAKSLGADVRFFLTESSFIGTAAQLKTKAYWEAGIKAKTVIPFPLATEIEPQDVEAAYFETSSGATFKTKAEKRKTMYQFIENIVTHSGMKSHDGRVWYVWLYTDKGYLRGHTIGTDSFQGLKVSNFFVNAQTTNTFSDPSHTPVIMEFENVDDWDMEFAVIQPEFDLKDLEGIFQTEVIVNSATSLTGTLTVVVDVNIKGSNAPLSGLLPTDFALKTSAGVAIILTSAMESGVTGVYTLVATNAATTGTVALKDVVTVGADNYQSNIATFATA